MSRHVAAARRCVPEAAGDGENGAARRGWRPERACCALESCDEQFFFLHCTANINDCDEVSGIRLSAELGLPYKDTTRLFHALSHSQWADMESKLAYL